MARKGKEVASAATPSRGRRTANSNRDRIYYEHLPSDVDDDFVATVKAYNECNFNMDGVLDGTQRCRVAPN
ncbi:hypothetical protein PIB30_097570 [Stylosanthes scabra]|uniref:Uncharacterized protein n=1 Tax=Stylosanthes scabra TaxID=79078 RepID=A0ABU6VV08_9FABA|nr:hypothetical protein [Stylosanthes scabra]